MAKRRTELTGTSTFALATLALLLGGCGGDADQQPATEQPAAEQAARVADSNGFDPCTLLTAEEVEATLGWAPVRTTPYPSGDLGSCTYVGPAGPEYGATGTPPQKVDVGISTCPPNIVYCGGIPEIGSSAELLKYRKDLYAEQAGDYSMVELHPIDDLGVPAIGHDLGLYSVEMVIPGKRLVYVVSFESHEKVRALAAKALARAR